MEEPSVDFEVEAVYEDADDSEFVWVKHFGSRDLVRIKRAQVQISKAQDAPVLTKGGSTKRAQGKKARGRAIDAFGVPIKGKRREVAMSVTASTSAGLTVLNKGVLANMDPVELYVTKSTVSSRPMPSERTKMDTLAEIEDPQKRALAIAEAAGLKSVLDQPETEQITSDEVIQVLTKGEMTELHQRVRAERFAFAGRTNLGGRPDPTPEPEPDGTPVIVKRAKPEKLTKVEKMARISDPQRRARAVANLMGVKSEEF